MIAFAVVTETVFAYPGMGKLLIDSINRLDRPIIVAYLMLTVVIFVVINLIVDLLYAADRPARAARRGEGLTHGGLRRTAMASRSRRSCRRSRSRPAIDTARASCGGTSPSSSKAPAPSLGLDGARRARRARRPRAPRSRRRTPTTCRSSTSWTTCCKPGEKLGSGITAFLGTDDQGRDMLSAIIYGLRISLAVGAISVVIACAIGASVGVLAAYAGGRVESVVMRIVDLQLSFPAILVALVLLAVFGRGVDKVVIALVIVQWAYYARTVRGSRACREAARIHRGGALPRPAEVAHRLPPPPAELPAAADRRRDRAGGARDRARIDAVVPRRRRAGDRALARHADRPPATTTCSPANTGSRPSRASPSSSSIVAINLVGDRLRDVLNPRLAR